MLAQNELTGHNRIIKFTGIESEIKELDVYVTYSGEGRVNRAIALDKCVIPKIITAVNCFDNAYAALMVIANDPVIRAYLEKYDPKALNQVCSAVTCFANTVPDTSLTGKPQ